MFNAIQIPDLLEYWYETCKLHNLSLSTPLNGVFGSMFLNRVSHPTYALVTNLSAEYREQGALKALDLYHRIERENAETEYKCNKSLTDSLLLLVDWLREPHEERYRDMVHAKSFIRLSDKYRNRNIADYIPELNAELDKLWNALGI
jgi:tRNA A37 threonylcarbamoyladenosine biosynthesis protein TsaE